MQRKSVRKEKRKRKSLGYWIPTRYSYPPMLTAMNEEKERMKELCAPVYEWVKSMK
ncbi:MAG: hypothetical protein ACXABD_19015 [Candidatus Thorarchaeota archaeon]